MATLYLDFINGNDANDCTSFANRGKTITSGATAARTAPGDTVRLMKSPDPTSLGQNGTWTSGRRGASLSVTSSTNATPIVVTLGSGHGLVNGDTISLYGHSTNTNANGIWEIANVTGTTLELVGSTGNAAGTGGTIVKRTSSRIKLTSAVTANIASYGNRGEGRTAWTAAANAATVLHTTVPYLRFFDCTDYISIQDAHTTGLVAYKATGTLDLSGYQQLSFRLYQVSGTAISTGKISIRLCSDTAGVTAVDTFAIPPIYQSGTWIPITINKGSALGSSIQSIAVYVDSDNGATAFYLDNIIACKSIGSADSLTHNSLIGKNTGTEAWWPIGGIYGTRVIVGDTFLYGDYTNINWMSYYGTTESVTTYKRECITPDMLGTFAWQNTQEAGAQGSLITYSGGWNTTDMSTQTGETWFDGRNGHTIGITLGAYIKLEKLGFVRYAYAIQANSSGYELSDISIAGCQYYGLSNGGQNGVISLKQAVCCGYHGVSESSTNTRFTSLKNLHANGVGMYKSGSGLIESIEASCNGGSGLYIGDSSGVIVQSAIMAANNYGVQLQGHSNSRFDNLTCTNNQTYSIYAYAAESIIRNLVSSGAITGIFSQLSELRIPNASISESTKYSVSAHHCAVYADDIIQGVGFSWQPESSIRHTASGVSRKVSVTSTDRTNTFPAIGILARVAVNANALVTIKAWMRRTNTGLTLKLVCKGGQIAGVPNDVSSSMTAAADTWEEVTITFTPTVQGVVEITAEAYGGTTYTGYVDDLTVSQA